MRSCDACTGTPKNANGQRGCQLKAALAIRYKCQMPQAAFVDRTSPLAVCPPPESHVVSHRAACGARGLATAASSSFGVASVQGHGAMEPAHSALAVPYLLSERALQPLRPDAKLPIGLQLKAVIFAMIGVDAMPPEVRPPVPQNTASGVSLN